MSQRVALIVVMVVGLAVVATPAPPNGTGCPAATVCFTPGGNGTQVIVHAVGEAQRTILAQAYRFTSALIAKA